MCWTMKMDAGRSVGNWPTSTSSASSPPADVREQQCFVSWEAYCVRCLSRVESDSDSHRNVMDHARSRLQLSRSRAELAPQPASSFGPGRPASHRQSARPGPLKRGPAPHRPLFDHPALALPFTRDGSPHSSETTTITAARARTRSLWQMHRPQRPQAILTTAI